MKTVQDMLNKYPAVVRASVLTSVVAGETSVARACRMLRVTRSEIKKMLEKVPKQKG